MCAAFNARLKEMDPDICRLTLLLDPRRRGMVDTADDAQLTRLIRKVGGYDGGP